MDGIIWLMAATIAFLVVVSTIIMSSLLKTQAMYEDTAQKLTNALQRLTEAKEQEEFLKSQIKNLLVDNKGTLDKLLMTFQFIKDRP